MIRLARLARRVGRKLKAMAPTPKAPEPPSLPLRLDGVGNPDFTTVRNVWCAPAFGVLVDSGGQVLGGVASQALSFSPDLSALPRVRANDGASRLILPDTPPRLTKGAVLAGWGDLRSYAGFLLNTLPALLAASEAGALGEHPFVAPPLAAWQADLLALAGLDAPQTSDAPWIVLDEAMVSPPLLPAPSHPLLPEVRARILLALGPASEARPKLYVSRADAMNAVMLDEEGVEIELAARGYTIVRPETASARELISLFREAETIVAPTGAALANILFCAPDARIVEIRPPGATSVWAQDLAARVGVTWHGFDAAGAIEAPGTPLDPILPPAAAFSWRADAAALLAFLAQRA
ncbi:capsular polysaccharide biosynthesis protein [Caulobacter sp. BE264]|uniref:glycosyltransferase family 61 protein n=1 Tax=Caulobacter sp. BE264 TaxID=2817724 RepID=UPI0028639305|nr:glycosyltransferase 61 family protein [Caulobacter sp. BE264]MDR7231153.1 capsular polysaccharide biosynthesis protein [Caulobacter sp. BE264]